MPLPGRNLGGRSSTGKRNFLLLTALALVTIGALGPARARAAVENEPIHASGDREIWDRRNNRVELFGHASVRQPGEQLSADHIVLDQAARTLDAHGNCVYVTSDSIIYGDEMHFNLDTRTGTIVGGRVANERFTLGGERINKLGDGKFQTHWGEYSTCRDCTQSWSLQAQDVDMEVEGYAHLKNVTVKLKDTPALWFPYLIVPMKTRRQTGLLFPQIALSGQNGFALVQPFFWAISRSADMTFGVGEYSKKGFRGTWEGRYALTDRSQGKANFYFLRDEDFGNPIETPLNPGGSANRWAVDVTQVQELPWGIEEKLRITEVSDNYYPIYIGDVPGLGEMTVSSIFSLSYASSSMSAFVGARRVRNLLDVNLDPTDGIRRFDPSTVQVYPSAVVTTNDQAILSGPSWPLAAGLTLGVTNFTRSSGPFDRDVLGSSASAPFPTPGVDPIREATRFSVTPTLYAPLRPWDVLTFTPSVKYFGYLYTFPDKVVDNWYRGYALFQADLSAQLERVYETDNPDRPRKKHLIRPILTYSYIPQSLVHQDSHPFLSQIQYAESRGFTGYNFDNLDIVPIDASPATGTQYFVPLGNSLAYGITTQLIQRKGKLDDPTATYVTPLEFSLGQAINFREFQKYRKEDPNRARDPQPLSRFFSTLNVNIDDKIKSDTTYYYYPYISGLRHQLSTSATYVIERSTKQRILSFDRSFSAGYTWNRVGCIEDVCAKAGTSNLVFGVNYSLSDYVLPSISASYDYQTQNLIRSVVNLQFQSPSQCWKLTLSGTKEIGQKPNWGIDLAVNLTGSGFGGASELVSQATASK